MGFILVQSASLVFDEQSLTPLEKVIPFIRGEAAEQSPCAKRDSSFPSPLPLLYLCPAGQAL